MKIFQCGNCQHPLFFENYACENCGFLSGYRDSDRQMLTFNGKSDRLISQADQLEYKFCKNHQHDVCNWLIPIDSASKFCTACQLNRTIPNLSDQQNFPKWKNLEVAKHRLIYQLQKIGLPLPSKLKNAHGLCFDFVSGQSNSKLMTGHANGVITILLREADSVIREQMRQKFKEPYRTLIGHLRHEVGHYFWDRLVYPDGTILEEFRVIFGDERVSYRESLDKYYKNGAPDNWQNSFISRYATAHAWEDWAETWAHYLHIMDMVETAHFFGVKVDPSTTLRGMEANAGFDPYVEPDFRTIVQTCIPLSFAVNSINRAMGVPDVYPFVISSGVVEKMKFIHGLVNKEAKYNLEYSKKKNLDQ
jgi:hypothetical protein